MNIKKILILGAGRSSFYLINYLLENADKENWLVTVVDKTIQLANEKTNNHPCSTALGVDILKPEQRYHLVSDSDIVISLLPPDLHFLVATDCLELKKHLFTASYISPEIQRLNEPVEKNNLLFMNEIGLDPGIDHISAIKIIHKIKAKNGKLISFKSYCGGLIAPECNDNPWNYKFTWNPRNVILAGQGTAKYLLNGKYKYVPYNRIFTNSEIVEVEGAGTYEAYPNRDSIGYRKIYGIEDISTMLRGTLRSPDFCNSWDIFIKLGLTDDSYQIENSKNMSYKELIESLLPHSQGKTLSEKICSVANVAADSTAYKNFLWTGIASDEKIPLEKASPAMILQNLLESKWKMNPNDKDMVVMHHEFSYINSNGNQKHISSSLVVKGENSQLTAMAKTVGLPLAITVKLFLQGKISLRGVRIPVYKEIYLPVLNELEKNGIIFSETEG